ncbi:uncharacterized protein LOC129239485 isoform X1 [Anastrepha obliqua]|uniref:uncharacterized protein LOC129239485 isoform X1 n=1 Tax=Anastrepha obliqua TaxID=95512 RepID=UPI002409C10A|nr:uncharacterized protein LOC129239485 isoform X1 [Anastrepha obliqua]
MSEFDGKKFYGFSLHNDPVLSTTTRNFEFKYTRAEHLERVIQKVQHSEPEHERHRKKDLFNRLSRAKKITTNTEVSTPYRRDPDVETHVSRSDAAGRVRNLSDKEINQLITKVKSYGDLRKHTLTDTCASSNIKTMRSTSISKGLLRPKTYGFPFGGDTSGTYNACAGTIHMDDCSFEDENSCDGEMLGTDSTSEDQTPSNPFDMSHEPLFETHTMHLPHVRRELHSKLPDVPEEDEIFSSKTVMPIIVEEFRQPQPRWVEVCETVAKETIEVGEIKTPLDTEADKLAQQQSTSENNERLPTNVTYTRHSLKLQLPLQISAPEMMLPNQPPPSSLPAVALTYGQSSYEDNPPTYDVVEDSDLEYEMIGRAEYTKLCGPRPRTEELTYNSNNSGGLAEFVEVEGEKETPCINLSFLKNVSPIRYSDLTDEREEDRTTELNQPMKVYIKKRAIKSASPPPVKEATTSDKKEAKKKIIQPRKKSNEPKPSPRKNSSARVFDSSPVTEKSPRTPRLSGRRSASITPKQPKDRSRQTLNSNELRAMKNIILTKSIEDLKMEKMAIFAKMTSMQERIIETLDKLRISLLELYVPDSHYDKTRRQKNAFEFSVRFSRNFLYPLKGMIEDLRLVSVEQLCSASSNESTQRVLNIFSLIHQSLQTYYKQLRYFLLDQVPQKLNTLIELAATTVNICLEKQIFDRNDAIIECLQDRCTKFLGFLEDMHEQRFLTARDNYRKASFEKTASNYSLKMFMNDLNMYEPKLVPKNHYNYRRKPKQRRVLKPSVTNLKAKLSKETAVTPKTSHMVITKPDGDQISTHIKKLASSSVLIHSMADEAAPPAEPSVDTEELPHLNKALVEALRTVTKEQIRQVLQPIMQTLGSVLEKKNASKTIEELLNAFNKNLISLAEGDNGKKTSTEKYSANRDKLREEEELKAAKQTERQQHNQHRHSSNESAKRHEAVAAFLDEVPTASAFETVICDIDVDDDDDNYYDDDEFENGDYIDDCAEDDDGNDDDIGKARDASNYLIEPRVIIEPIKATQLTGYFRDECAGKRNNNTNNNTASNSDIVVFDNFKLNYEYGGDVASESGSDFVSFEENSSNFDVGIAIKPDNNKVNDQQQVRYNSNKKEQQQHKKEQQQLNKFEQHEQSSANKQGKPNKLEQQQIEERQHQKSLRERTENYDTHIQQQQQLLLQQAYEQEKLERHLKKRNGTAINNQKTEQILKESRNPQQQLQQQLEVHQQCIAEQQQHLHQNQLQSHRKLEQKQQLMLQEQQILNQQQQQFEQKQTQLATPKPLTRKQLQLQALQPARVAHAARHSARASSSLPPSSRLSALIDTSRGRATARPNCLTSSQQMATQGERGVKILKKRRNPLNPPPPPPSVTPTNSARSPRNADRLGEPSLRPSLTEIDMLAAGGDASASMPSNCSNSEMLKVSSKLKSDFFEMMSPHAKAIYIGNNEEQRLAKPQNQSKSQTKKPETLANRELVEALTNCLFNYNNSMSQKFCEKEGKEVGEGMPVVDLSTPVTLYTGESPYEKVELKKTQPRLKKKKRLGYDKEQTLDECIAEISAADEQDAVDASHKSPTTVTQHNKVDSKYFEPIVSPCTLWNSDPEPATQKKDLHIEELIAERDHFLSLCSKNRFYANPNFNQPWSVFSKLANRLSNDIIAVIEKDFSIGVSKFVQDFLDNETKI